MNAYRADLHIHTVLSPCGSLDMSPVNIVRKALEMKLDIIGIADHNSTKQAKVVRDLGKDAGLFVLCGAEVNTKEDIHGLAFFKNDKQLDVFQLYLDEHLPKIKNKPELFGDQVWVDGENNISGEEESLLIVGLNQSLEQVVKKVQELQGIFIPSHVDKPRYSVISQIGFLPKDLPIFCIELSAKVQVKNFLEKYPWVRNYNRIVNSDAHVIELIGSFYSILQMEAISFEEIVMALKGIDGRMVISSLGQ